MSASVAGFAVLFDFGVGGDVVVVRCRPSRSWPWCPRRSTLPWNGSRAFWPARWRPGNWWWRPAARLTAGTAIRAAARGQEGDFGDVIFHNFYVAVVGSIRQTNDRRCPRRKVSKKLPAPSVSTSVMFCARSSASSGMACRSALAKSGPMWTSVCPDVVVQNQPARKRGRAP